MGYNISTLAMLLTALTRTSKNAKPLIIGRLGKNGLRRLWVVLYRTGYHKAEGYSEYE